MNIIDIGLYIAYILLFLTIGSVIIIPLYFTFVNFKKAKQGLIGIVLLAIVVIVAYLVSPADQGLLYETKEIGPSGSKIIGGGLLTTYFGFIAIIIAILYAEIGKLFK